MSRDKLFKYGIVGDIHANLEAFETALGYLHNEKVDVILCLGDIVGYNADPVRCLELARENCSAIIRGNHDRYCSGETPENVRESVSNSAQWTISQCSEADRKYLRSLGDHQVINDTILIVHGSPRDRDEYILSVDAVCENLYCMKEKFLGLDICFFGHSHIPIVAGGGSIKTGFRESVTIQLDRYTTYLINPGSVGQPRDRCPLASCGIIDMEAFTFHIERLPYDIEKTQKKVLEAGLDKSSAERLKHGV